MLELIRLEKGISIVSPYPCILLEEHKTLLFADTHLGLEEHRERLGIHVPYPITDHIIECILKPVKELNCSKVIILGDVKHEFGKPSRDEWYSLKKLVYLLRKEDAELEVVRGNHDNYIIYILKELNVKLHEPYLLYDRLLLTHGHINIDINSIANENDIRGVIMGHEHPCIVLKDDIGSKHRFKAFLHGCITLKDDKKISLVVLPSLSPLAYGNPLNEDTVLKSPILREFNHAIDDLVPYIIDVEVTVKRFPEIKYLRYSNRVIL